MLRITAWLGACLLCYWVLPLAAQQAMTTASNSTDVVVPPLVSFSGVLAGMNNKPLTGVVGVTFALYKDEQGGAPLWMETQNVQPDKTGHYSVMLGSTLSQGLPSNLFVSGAARWLGAQAQGQAEQPRILVVAVPYALKALDAETIGGKPASAFMPAPAKDQSAGSGPSPNSTITGRGTADYLPMFTGTTTIGNSKVYQNPSGQIGIGTTSPAAMLDVHGKGDIRDTLTLFPKSTDPALKLNGSVFQVSNNGTVTFVSGQTFPGTGTITGVTAGSGLNGGGSSGNVTLSVPNSGITNPMLQNSSLKVNAGTALTGGGVVSLGGSATLNLDTTKVPLLAADNTFTGTQTIDNNVRILGSGPGSALSVSGATTGVTGQTVTNGGSGLYGADTSSTGGYAIYGVSTNGTGVYGADTASQTGVGVYGTSNSPFGVGIYGADTASQGGVGVYGTSNVAEGDGVVGVNLGPEGNGVVAEADGYTGWGVVASGNIAVYALGSPNHGTASHQIPGPVYE